MSGFTLLIIAFTSEKSTSCLPSLAAFIMRSAIKLKSSFSSDGFGTFLKISSTLSYKPDFFIGLMKYSSLKSVKRLMSPNFIAGYGGGFESNTSGT